MTPVSVVPRYRALSAEVQSLSNQVSQLRTASETADAEKALPEIVQTLDRHRTTAEKVDEAIKVRSLSHSEHTRQADVMCYLVLGSTANAAIFFQQVPIATCEQDPYAKWSLSPIMYYQGKVGKVLQYCFSYPVTPSGQLLCDSGYWHPPNGRTGMLSVPVACAPCQPAGPPFCAAGAGGAGRPARAVRGGAHCRRGLAEGGATGSAAGRRRHRSLGGAQRPAGGQPDTHRNTAQRSVRRSPEHCPKVGQTVRETLPKGRSDGHRNTAQWSVRRSEKHCPKVGQMVRETLPKGRSDGQRSTAQRSVRWSPKHCSMVGQMVVWPPQRWVIET